MRYLLIFLILYNSLGLIEKSGQESPSLVLKTGEQAMIGNLAIKFKEVISDSRCPKGVTCIWAGEAKVLVGVYEDNRLVGEEILTLTTAGSEISGFGDYFSAMNLQVIGGNLQPYPVIGQKTVMEDYCLRLQFKKKEAEKQD